MLADIIGSKKLLSIIENIVSTFARDQRLYKNEIYSKALVKILEPIICSGMVCVNIFRRDIMTYVCLICLFVHLTFCSFYILLFSDW
jgi:hypothetical protein